MERCIPVILGMAQYEHCLLHPSEILEVGVMGGSGLVSLVGEAHAVFGLESSTIFLLEIFRKIHQLPESP